MGDGVGEGVAFDLMRQALEHKVVGGFFDVLRHGGCFAFECSAEFFGVILNQKEARGRADLVERTQSTARKLG